MGQVGGSIDVVLLQAEAARALLKCSGMTQGQWMVGGKCVGAWTHVWCLLLVTLLCRSASEASVQWSTLVDGSADVLCSQLQVLGWLRSVGRTWRGQEWLMVSLKMCCCRLHVPRRRRSAARGVGAGDSTCGRER